MTNKFDGKVALVTGGASGIGRVSALAFARQGAKVVLADVAVKEGEGVALEINGSGGEATFVRCDVANPDDAQALVAKAIQTWGRIDFAFNNAGITGSRSTTTECTPENFDRVMGVNVRGVWLCMKYEIPQMTEQGTGAIVNAASIAGMGGSPKNPAYAASKAAVANLTRSAAMECARLGIRINAVAPGFIRTRMTTELLSTGIYSEAAVNAMLPIGRMGEPMDVVEAVLWLCSDAASYITGQILCVDGGLTAGSL